MTHAISQAWVEESERIEMLAWCDLLAAAPPELARTLGCQVVAEHGTTAILCPGLDHMLVNRIFGVGHDPTYSIDRLGRLLARFSARGIRRLLLHTPALPQPPELTEWLLQAGLERYRRDWIKFGRVEGPVTPTSSALRVAQVAPRDAAACGRIACEALGLPAPMSTLFASLVGRPRWHLFAAYEDEQPVATAGLFVHGSTGYLAFAGTRESHRCRGAQATLIERRVRLAFALGVTWLVSETGAAVEGEPQHSYQNLSRAGLVPLFVRPNWVLAGQRW
jgi:hypothetical protein